MLSHYSFFNQSKAYLELVDLFLKEQKIKAEIENIQNNILFKNVILSLQTSANLVELNFHIVTHQAVLKEIQSTINTLLTSLPNRIPVEFSLTYPKEAQFIKDMLNAQTHEAYEKLAYKKGPF